MRDLKITRNERKKSWNITFLSCGLNRRVDHNFKNNYQLFIVSVQCVDRLG